MELNGYRLWIQDLIKHKHDSLQVKTFFSHSPDSIFFLFDWKKEEGGEKAAIVA